MMKKVPLVFACVVPQHFWCVWQFAPLSPSTAIDNWRTFIYYLCEALEALPRIAKKVYRGIGIKFNLSLYGPGVACLCTCLVCGGCKMVVLWISMEVIEMTVIPSQWPTKMLF